VPGERKKEDHHAGDSKYDHIVSDKAENAKAADKSTGHGAKIGLVTMLVIVALVSGVALWVFYAYKHPQTGAGQFLIKYRPQEWQWRPSDTRYTAASIHM